MVDVRQKGAAGEYKVRDLLRNKTGLPWERVPMSGALPYLKGDLYVPHSQMHYCVEVKNYKDPAIDHLLIQGKPKLLSWWNQTLEQTKLPQEPVLFFRWNRSRIYVMIQGMPLEVDDFIFLNHLNASILLAEDWLDLDKPEFIK